MSEEIIKVLDALAEKFGLAVDWTSGNIIPYLQALGNKFVSYEIVTSVIWILIGLGFCFVSLYLIKKLKANKNWGIERYGGEVDGVIRWLAEGGVFVILAIGIIIIISQMFDIVTDMTFPEKMILRELQIFYNGMQQS